MKNLCQRCKRYLTENALKCKNCELAESIYKKHNNPISYRLHILETSKPEQYIYIFFKKLFPDTIIGKTFNWLSNSHFDIFIPSLNLAIEYDGYHYHYEKQYDDFQKNTLAQEHGISVFRIREKGLIALENSYCFTYNYTSSYNNIYVPINSIICFINKNYGYNIKTIEDTNALKIFDFLNNNLSDYLYTEIYNKSILNCWPEIVDIWDFENNYNLSPAEILPDCKALFFAKCPYCHKNTAFIPRDVYKYFGKISFYPHTTNICKESIIYFINLLKYNLNNHFTNFSMSNLDDRRLKDFLLNYKNYYTFSTFLKNQKLPSIDKLIEKYKIKY